MTTTGTTTPTFTLPARCLGRDEDPNGDPDQYGDCHWLPGIPITGGNGAVLYYESAHGMCCGHCYATGGSVVWPKEG